MIFDFAKCSGDNTDLGTYDKLPSGSLILFMDSSPGEEFALVPPGGTDFPPFSKPPLIGRWSIRIG
jgi:hypothetical protein